jgi:hypothetical protein
MVCFFLTFGYRVEVIADNVVMIESTLVAKVGIMCQLQIATLNTQGLILHHSTDYIPFTLHLLADGRVFTEGTAPG